MATGVCVDLFCGAGGLSHGMIQAGFSIGFGIDVDSAALLTFARNHPQAQAIKADVRELSGASLREWTGGQRILGLVGGPPCQSFSVAGKHDPNDARSELPYEYARLLHEAQPAFFLMENVKGLLSKKQRVHFEAVCALFAAAGYTLYWRVLNAWHYGVAQTRERVIIIGFRNDLRVSFDWPEENPLRPVLRDAIGDLPEPSGEATGMSNHSLTVLRPSSMVKRMQNKEGDAPLYRCVVQEWEKPSKTITAHLAKEVDLAHPGYPANHGPVPQDTEQVLRLIAAANADGVIPLDVLQEEVPSRVHFLKGRQKRGAWHRPNPTITAQSGFYTGAHYHPCRANPRRFTVRECARIQSFPDDFVFYGSLSAQYRQVGNAVPPKLAYALALQIAKALQAAARE